MKGAHNQFIHKVTGEMRKNFEVDKNHMYNNFHVCQVSVCKT